MKAPAQEDDMFDDACRNRVALCALGLLVALSACKKEEPETPPTPAPSPTPPPPPPPPAPPPPPEVTTGPCDAATTLALQTAIQAREKKEVSPGMKAEGAFTCERLAEGTVATVAVTLQPGKCYTLLAASFPNVTEVDLFLKPNFGNPAPPLLVPFANMVLAQDSETGPTASVGQGKNCYKNPLPIPGAGMVEVKARTGGGPVAVQVYSR
jgi:hypothetical protein